MTDPILLRPPAVGDSELKAIVDAFRSGWVAPAGPALDKFEDDLAHTLGIEPGSVLCLSSGSAALHLGLIELGVMPGDEVVVQSATFAATAFAAVHAGATPVFIDSEADTGNMCPHLLREFLVDRAATSQLPTAVVTVDLFGKCADYERLLDVCQEFEVPLLQDAAEAIGSTAFDQAAGTHGELGVLSFNGNKMITTSGGGALVGPPERLIRSRKLASQARESVAHYEHVEVGYNYRLSNLLAALGSAQLSRLDEMMTRREAAHQRYVSHISDVSWFPDGVTTRWNHWVSVAFLPPEVSAMRVCAQLNAEMIEARPFWKPMHLQPVFDGLDMLGGRHCEQMFEHGICLPSGVETTNDDLDRVVQALTTAIS